MKAVKFIAVWLLMTFIICWLVIGLFGCNPQKKINKAIATLKAADQLDDVCATEFPVITKYIPGDTVVTFDTLFVGGEMFIDTVETKDTVLITKVVTLPAKTITKTIRIVDTLKQRDNAYENVLADSLNKYKSLYLVDHDYRVWMEKKLKGNVAVYIPWWLIITLSGIGALLLFTWFKTKALNPFSLFKK